MRSRALLAVLALAAPACGGDPFESAVPPATTSTVAESAETASTEPPPSSPPSSAAAVSTAPTTTSVAPASLPLSEEPTGAKLPEGMTTADLADDPADRLDVMTDWLEAIFPERTSGHAYSFFDDLYDITFNVNVVDEAEARELCPFFTELTELYLYDTEHSVHLNGWIISDSGFFEEAEWDRFTC